MITFHNCNYIFVSDRILHVMFLTILNTLLGCKFIASFQDRFSIAFMYSFAFVSIPHAGSFVLFLIQKKEKTQCLFPFRVFQMPKCSTWWIMLLVCQIMRLLSRNHEMIAYRWLQSFSFNFIRSNKMIETGF